MLKILVMQTVKTCLWDQKLEPDTDCSYFQFHAYFIPYGTLRLQNFRQRKVCGNWALSS